MSNEIEVNRWAAVVRGVPCCGADLSLPIPFIVQRLTVTSAPAQCKTCGAIVPKGLPLASGYGGDPRVYVLVSRLKRLDDLPAENAEPRAIELPPPLERALA